MKQFNKVDVGVHSKKYRRPLYFEVNSTAPWGVSQPCLVQKLDGKSRIVGNYSDLLRLSPLPVPTYANMYKETTLRFVPISQICPFYENMLSKQNVYVDGSYVTYNHVPLISNSFLVLMLCVYFCSYNEFYPIEQDVDNEYKYGDGYEASTIIESHFGIRESSTFYSLLLEDLDVNFSNKYSESVTINNADFCIRMKNSPRGDIYLLCKLNRYGRILRSNLIGCGFSLNIDDDRPLSMLPLLAYYKAYYDTYAPQRVQNWQTSYCFKLIQALTTRLSDNNNDLNFILSGDYGIINNVHEIKCYQYFRDFFKNELAYTFATSPLDIVSACRDTPENLVESEVTFYDTENQTYRNEAGDVPNLNNSSRLSSIGIHALDYLTKFIAKASAIGEQLSKRLSVLFNADLSNSTLFDSNRIGYYRLDCKVNPIFSTSDTSTPAGEGEYLGSFAGTGFAQNSNNSYDFSSGEIGYVIGLTAILPDSSYYQGNQYDLHAVDRDTIFNSQYDALGYEILPYGNLVSDNGISFEDFNVGNTSLNEGFGFLPRYSQLKSVKNIVNGDMSRRSTADSMSAYFLDKQIVTRSYELSVKDADSGVWNFKLTESMPPQASEEWQYPCKYKWLGNFDRIFYNSGKLDVGLFESADDEVDDNFMFQMSFNYSIYDNKKSVSRSYCTYDDDDQIQTIQQS